ncbi:MAG: SAM-dependent methyltransferase [Deltaproteobacteria bacterium]|nr:SAM-dependent methyltransferase [Deltaproteobacteria bacterium]
MNSEEWNPGKLLGLSGGYWNACTLHGAVKLGVFTLIGRERLSAEQVAARLPGDLRGVTMLLNALAALHLLRKEDERYANSDFSTAFLGKESPQYLGHIIMHHHHLVEPWSKLDQGVLTGKPTRSRQSFDKPEVREAFLMGMFNIAMGQAPLISTAVDLSGRRHLLDLGGGPGTYAIHFCLKNPQLRATVYDLPTTRPFAESTILRFGVSERATFQEGDYLEGTIAGRYDAVWLSQILHGEGPEEAQQVIHKAAAALEPGGLILVHEFLLNDNLDGPLFPALFSLNMLVNTETGQSYSEGQIKDMLARAGARDIRRLPVQTPNDSGIIQGTIPG